MKLDELGKTLLEAENERLRLELACMKKWAAPRERMGQRGPMQGLLAALKRQNWQLRQENSRLLGVCGALTARARELESRLAAQQEEITRAYASLRNENGFLRATLKRIKVALDCGGVSHEDKAENVLKNIQLLAALPEPGNMQLRDDNERLRQGLRELAALHKSGRLTFADETLNQALEENIFNLD